VRNWETNRLVHQLAKRLHVSARRVRFSGVKDKRAVTTQLLTVEAPVEQVRGCACRRRGARGLATAAHVSLGDHASNAFEIAVTRLEVPDEEVRARIAAVMAELGAVGGSPTSTACSGSA